MAGGVRDYWTLPIDDVLRGLDSRPSGLTSREAAARLAAARGHRRRTRRTWPRARLLWRQLRSPLILLLVFAAGVGGATGAWAEAAMVLGIIAVTVGIGFGREYQAERAAATLANRLAPRTTVRRDGIDQNVLRASLVAGDVVVLSAGTLVPADGLVIDAADLFVNEAPLTGESFPVAKRPGAVGRGTPLGRRSNTMFLGTDVRSGTGLMLVVRTDDDTELGRIADRLERPAPETDFDRGLRRLGYFLTVSMLMLVIMILVVHVLRGRPVAETLLFSIALAVGLSPELMPAILSVNLARGASQMAARGVLVRRLNAIENLGSMDVLCTDKTGTLTEGVIELSGSYRPDGTPDGHARDLAILDATLSTGVPNPLDAAILAGSTGLRQPAQKLAEVPFDFTRRRVSVVVAAANGTALLITKGSVAAVLAATADAGGATLTSDRRGVIDRLVAEWGRHGIRVVAVATRRLPRQGHYTPADEAGMSLEGFVTFCDRPKADARRAVSGLEALHVSIKLITGDSRFVAAHVAEEVGLNTTGALTGADVARMDDATLARAAETTDVFAETDPAQKERILLALKRAGHVVGFLGDGVNDAPAMHAADTSVSVDGAADVAREAADFVLLEQDLDVIRGGIEEGRRTFINTRKYILLTMSANLGNMLSMATASLFLPFLPMTAAQILAINLVSDVPAFGLASDRADRSATARPPRWDLRLIGSFMIEFGLISCAFDVLTFAMLVMVFHASVPSFQTAWLVESLLTELVMALIVRTEGPFYLSRPGTFLLSSTIAMVAATFAAPYLPGAGWLGLVPLPWALVSALAAVTVAYALAIEVGKLAFYRRGVAGESSAGTRRIPHAA
jgi:Mg2+-importing ATPase